MLMDEWYDRRNSVDLPVSKKIVFGILADLKDRRGLRQEFEGIDDEIKEEILTAWIEIVEHEINP